MRGSTATRAADRPARFAGTGRTVVSGSTAPLAEPPLPAAIDLSGLEAALSESNDNARIPRTSAGRPALSGPAGRTLVVGDGDRLDLPEGTYFLDGLRLEGSAVLALEGRVRLLVTGSVVLSGRSRLNPESGPYFLRLWSSGPEVKLEGTSSAARVRLRTPGRGGPRG